MSLFLSIRLNNKNISFYFYFVKLIKWVEKLVKNKQFYKMVRMTINTTTPRNQSYMVWLPIYPSIYKTMYMS